MPAYEANSVPDQDNVTYPYITYEAVLAGFDEDAIIDASIWTRSTSWNSADALANSVFSLIKDGGLTISYDTGMLWFTPETPFAQSMGDPDDDLIKRKRLSVLAHFY